MIGAVPLNLGVRLRH